MERVAHELNSSFHFFQSLVAVFSPELSSVIFLIKCTEGISCQVCRSALGAGGNTKESTCSSLTTRNPQCPLCHLPPPTWPVISLSLTLLQWHLVTHRVSDSGLPTTSSLLGSQDGWESHLASVLHCFTSV